MPLYRLVFEHDGESVLRVFESPNHYAAIVAAYAQMPQATQTANLTVLTPTLSKMIFYLDLKDNPSAPEEFVKPTPREELERSMAYREAQYKSALEVEHKKAEEDLRAEKDWIAKKFPV